MKSITGLFKSKRNYGKALVIALAVIAFIIAFFLLSIMFARNTQDAMMIFAFVLILFISFVVWQTRNSHASHEQQFRVTLVSDGVIMTLQTEENGKTETFAQNLKWHEITLYEYLESRGRYLPPEIRRYLHLRIWNQDLQVVLVEPAEEGESYGYPIRTIEVFDKPDFISLEKGTLQKMAELAKECGLYTD
jgi:hypothetical protein